MTGQDLLQPQATATLPTYELNPCPTVSMPLPPPLMPSPNGLPSTLLPPPSARKRVLMLGNRRTITFTDSDIPDPRAHSFADDIPDLNRKWDDTSPYWDGTASLKIKGHPIALVYWPTVYSRHRPYQWTGIKQKWGEWQVCLSF
jgi:hypothetical protein